MSKIKLVHELDAQTRSLAVAAYAAAHGSAPDFGFAPDRGWVEGWAYAQQRAEPAPAAVAVPEGWALVPVNPTTEMCKAANWSSSNRQRWADMLAAAPALAATPPAQAQLSPVAAQVIENLLQLARIVNLAVEDWGESFADGSCEVKFHKEEADKMESILEFFDSLPDAPTEEGVVESGPLRAARVLRTMAAPQAQDVQRDAELVQALGDLSFDCFDGFGTKAPSVEVYNRTFAVFDKHRAAIAASASKGGEA